MNERIKELKAQATSTKTVYVNEIDESWEVLDEELFAELIVKECAEVCKRRHVTTSFDYNIGRVHCSEEIKTHFGVE